jgi:hypothetical protein
MREKVYTVDNYYDGILEGVADFEGRAHHFESAFNEALDDYSQECFLTPLDSDIFSLEMQNWDYWLYWLKFQGEDVKRVPHPQDYAEMRKTQKFDEIDKTYIDKTEWERAERYYQNSTFIAEFLSQRKPTIKAKSNFMGRGYDGSEASVEWSEAEKI